MRQRIPFSKIEATGNDFIVFEASDLGKSHLSRTNIRKLCHRRFGIGADGVIIMDHMQMHYFNADGSAGEMCGNGLRAATRFAVARNWLQSGQEAAMYADDGTHRVMLKSEEYIKVEIRQLVSEKKIPFDAARFDPGLSYLGYLNTGVPHVVLEVLGDLEKVNVKEIGKKIRNHSTFAPEGTNVNFLKIGSSTKVQLRTYERGIEAETLSCGTGSVASALTFFKRSAKPEQKLTVETRGGTLEVEKNKAGVFLTGPAHLCFTGLVDLDKLDKQTTLVF